MSDAYFQNEVVDGSREFKSHKSGLQQSMYTQGSYYYFLFTFAYFQEFLLGKVKRRLQ